MFNIFRSLIERLKALFAATAAQEFEAEFLARHAERKAELLRLAAGYDAEGLTTLAQELRQQAENLNVQQPLAIILPVVVHLQGNQAQEALLPLEAASTSTPNNHTEQPQLAAPKKKGGSRDRNPA